MDVINLMFASLLHDIGKFYQRTGIKHSNEFNNLGADDFGWNGAHGKWSSDFIKNFWNEDIANLALYHHNPGKSDFPVLCGMLSKADHHSSKERVKVSEKQEVLESPLISIFSKVNLGDNDECGSYYVPLKELSLNEDSFDFLKPAENVMSGWNLQPEYKVLWKKFTHECSKINNVYDFNTVLSLLKKYTSTIPSAVYTSEGDISLFDHSKTTAAIGLNRYKYDVEMGDLKKTVDSQYVYLAVNGDISGIQNFIYKIASPEDAQKGMSKRLRGRSLYLTLLSESIVSYIIRELGLSDANILFCGGGRFTIIAYNTPTVLSKLNSIKEMLNNFFINDFNSELYLSLTSTPFNGEDLGNFNQVINELSAKTEKDKKHKFLNQLNDIFTVEDKVKYKNTCSVCGKVYNKKNDEKICPDCQAHEKLGADVSKNSDYMIKCYTQKDDDEFSVYFKPLKIGYIFKNNSNKLIDDINHYCENFDKVEVIRLNSTDFLDLSNKINPEYRNVSFSFSFIGNNVPKFNSGKMLSFDQLSLISKGSNKLGVLKMDVDNLGLIFSQGLKNPSNDKGISLSRVSTLSSSLELFFSGFINSISKKFRVYNKTFTNSSPILLEEDGSVKVYKEELNENFTSENIISTIYINYSGGDDLLVIGPYDDLISFSKEIHDKFKEWTCKNPSINISAGISIVNHKFPIGKSALMADDFLEVSKSCGKDKITLFNETVPWETKEDIKGFDEIFQFTKKLERYTGEGKISKGFDYSLLNLWKKTYNGETNLLSNESDWISENKDRIEFKDYIPILKYKLRLVTDKQAKEYLDKECLKFMPWIKIPVSWVSLRMR